jgi:hypothetical protein
MIATIEVVGAIRSAQDVAVEGLSFILFVLMGVHIIRQQLKRGRQSIEDRRSGRAVKSRRNR